MAACTYYREVALSDALALDAVTKQNKLYVASLRAPLRIKTPPVEVVTPLSADEPWVFIKPQGKFAGFLRDAEAVVLEACLREKHAWLRKDADDAELRQRFKSFFRDDGAFKVKVQGDVAVFDDAGLAACPEEATAGRCVQCVLELSRVCFGRKEFGAMWRLVQARVVEVQPCLLDVPTESDPADDAAEESDACDDPDEREFQ